MSLLMHPDYYRKKAAIRDCIVLFGATLFIVVVVNSLKAERAREALRAEPAWVIPDSSSKTEIAQ